MKIERVALGCFMLILLYVVMLRINDAPVTIVVVEAAEVPGQVATEAGEIKPDDPEIVQPKALTRLASAEMLQSQSNSVKQMVHRSEEALCKTNVLSLEYVKEHLDQWYDDVEIKQTAQIIQAEDLIAYSQTIWAAHAWVIADREVWYDAGICAVLAAPGQFSTYTAWTLSQEVNPEIEWIVRDVFARKVLEGLGASEEVVGRVVPSTHQFFDQDGKGGFYNEFFRYWTKDGRHGDVYDPFTAPYNPYPN